MLVKALPRDATVVIWGAGGRGRLFEFTLAERRPDVRIAAYADTYKTGAFGPYDVLPVSELAGLDFDHLVIASAYANDILRALPEALLPKALYFDPASPVLDCAGGEYRRVAVVSSLVSQAMLMNFFNLDLMPAGGEFTVVHLDPAWTFDRWNALLRSGVEEGRVVHHRGADPARFDAAYIVEYGNAFVHRFLDATPLAGLPFAHAGLRARLRATVLGLRKRFGALNVLEFGSICSVSGGNLSTLAIAEALGEGDTFDTVNIDADAIESARAVCLDHPRTGFHACPSGDYLERHLAAMGDIHFACLLHQPCSEAIVADEFARLDAHIPDGGRALFAYNRGMECTPGLTKALDAGGYAILKRDNAGWLVEKALG